MMKGYIDWTRSAKSVDNSGKFTWWINLDMQVSKELYRRLEDENALTMNLRLAQEDHAPLVPKAEHEEEDSTVELDIDLNEGTSPPIDKKSLVPPIPPKPKKKNSKGIE